MPPKLHLLRQCRDFRRLLASQPLRTIEQRPGIAARVVDLKQQTKVHLPTTRPDQAIFALVLRCSARLFV